MIDLDVDSGLLSGDGIRRRGGQRGGILRRNKSQILRMIVA